MAKTYISRVETAKLVRIELKKHFPSIKFSVTGTRGSSIDVNWKDGPTTKQVEKVAGHFHGGEFDAMQDLQYFNERPYMNHFIFFNRDCSDKWYEYTMKKLIRDHGLNPSLIATPDKWDESMRAHDWVSLRNGAWRELSSQDLTGKAPPEAPSIVKDWTHLRDWELAELAKRQYPEALTEQKRRHAEAATEQKTVKPQRHSSLRSERVAKHRRSPRLSR